METRSNDLQLGSFPHQSTSVFGITSTGIYQPCSRGLFFIMVGSLTRQQKTVISIQGSLNSRHVRRLDHSHHVRICC